jgi:ribosomal protein S18 acetylase RimI-like enzyme
MLVQSVMDTNQSIKTGYASPVKSAALCRQWQIVDVITLAFSTDPVARWAYPDSQQYLQYFSNFVRLFGGKAFEIGSAYYVGNFAAASLWLPPGVHPDEQGLISLFESTVADEVRNDLYGVFEQMGDFHPAEPHWYLPLIGTDPMQQGKGLGSVLLRHAVSLCDLDNKPAYLESSNPKNIPLYQRFGFEVIGEIQVGSSPPLFPMLRRPRNRFNEPGSKFIQIN